MQAAAADSGERPARRPVERRRSAICLEQLIATMERVRFEP